MQTLRRYRSEHRNYIPITSSNLQMKRDIPKHIIRDLFDLFYEVAELKEIYYESLVSLPKLYSESVQGLTLAWGSQNPVACCLHVDPRTNVTMIQRLGTDVVQFLSKDLSTCINALNLIQRCVDNVKPTAISRDPHDEQRILAISRCDGVQKEVEFKIYSPNAFAAIKFDVEHKHPRETDDGESRLDGALSETSFCRQYTPMTLNCVDLNTAIGGSAYADEVAEGQPPSATATSGGRNGPSAWRQWLIQDQGIGAPSVMPYSVDFGGRSDFVPSDMVDQ